MDELAPWLRRVYLECRLGELRKFVDENRLGMLPLAKDNKLLTHIHQGMAQSAQNFGVHYKISGFWDSNITKAV
jgi:hypothetical protein